MTSSGRAFLNAVLILVFSLGSMLSVSASDDDEKVIQTIKNIINQKQVCQKHDAILNWLTHSHSFPVQCACLDALNQSQCVMPEIRNGLLSIIRQDPGKNVTLETIQRRQVTWAALFTQASIMGDDDIVHLLEKVKESEYNYVFELAGLVDIKEDTRAKILKYTGKIDTWWAATELGFFRTELGQSPIHPTRKTISAEIRRRDIGILREYLKLGFDRSIRVLAATTLLQIGEKDAAATLAGIFQEDFTKLKQKKESLSKLIWEVKVIDGIAGGKLDCSGARDEQSYEKCITACIEWLQEQKAEQK